MQKRIGVGLVFLSLIFGSFEVHAGDAREHKFILSGALCGSLLGAILSAFAATKAPHASSEMIAAISLSGGILGASIGTIGGSIFGKRKRIHGPRETHDPKLSQWNQVLSGECVREKDPLVQALYKDLVQYMEEQIYFPLFVQLLEQWRAQGDYSGLNPESLRQSFMHFAVERLSTN